MAKLHLLSYISCERLNNSLTSTECASYSEVNGLLALRQNPATQTANPKIQMSVPEETSLADSKSIVPQVETSVRARVLLAEDDRALRRFLEVVLQRAGYKVIPAADGLEAMKIALSTEIDIVVTDAMMPNLSGYEFCRFIRNSQTLSHLPVILLSAMERKETNQDSEHVDAFLTKPVSGESLIECIERLLARKKQPT
jgi:CheY-like chemotaxis protein